MTIEELREIVTRADRIDWTRDSEYMRLFGTLNSRTAEERIGVEKDGPRHPPRPPMSPFGDDSPSET